MADVKLDKERLVGLRLAGEQSPMQAAALAVKSGIIKCNAEPMDAENALLDRPIPNLD